MKGHIAEDITGQIFGQCKVLGRAPILYDENGKRVAHQKASWLIECLVCGTQKTVRGDHLRSGKIISCGCVGLKHAKEKHYKHGGSKTKLYYVWNDIKNRCNNPSIECYERYGGRGITVCDEWKNDFNTFKEWCYANGYNENAEFMQCQIDRIDNNGPYAPWNCRFVTAKENAANRRPRKKA